MKILQFPLSGITLAFLFGIALYQKCKPNLLSIFIALSIGLALLIIFHYLSRRKAIYKYLFAALAAILSFIAGTSTAAFHNNTLRPNHYTHFILDGTRQQITLTVHEKLKGSSKNSRYVAYLNTIDNQEVFGKIILNIRQPNHITNLLVGSQIKTYGNIYRNKNPFNPNQFDYGRYLENQQIYAQIYIDEKELSFTGSHETLWSRFSNFRTSIIKNLERSHFKKEELSLVIALLLGQQQDISPEILKEYQLAGAVHILSVSGLHVGFILLFITFLLKPIANSKRNALLKLFIIIVALWSYGILAGLAPSVIRSVTMFSFVAVGNHLKRTTNPFHTLLVSMFLILLWKPSFLFDVGFQLSYLALFFILWLQPLLSGIWKPQNKIFRYFWDILTVSFAAQIGTMPLSIYYFHQFPGLFFVTNIIVLPLLGIIMVLGLIAIVIACFGEVPFIIVRPLELLIEFQNSMIRWVASFEEFIFNNISFNTAMLWLSYLMIATTILWMKKPKPERLMTALISIVVLQAVFIYTKSETRKTQELIVFNVRKNSIISDRHNSQVTIYSNDSILNTLDNNLNIQSYLTGNFCDLKEKKELQNFMFSNGKKIIVIDNSAVYPKDIQPDVIILINSPKLNLKRLINILKPKQLVVDGSNYKSYVKLWKDTCTKEKIPFHYTNEKGFYKI